MIRKMLGITLKSLIYQIKYWHFLIG